MKKITIITPFEDIEIEGTLNYEPETNSIDFDINNIWTKTLFFKARTKFIKSELKAIITANSDEDKIHINEVDYFNILEFISYKIEYYSKEKIKEEIYLALNYDDLHSKLEENLSCSERESIISISLGYL